MKSRAQMTRRSEWIVVICVCLLGSCSLMPQARTNICAAGASLTNPEVGTGIGGTGQMAGLPGISGSGQVASSTGIGGTGRPLALAEVGIGGTGIVGVVTGFASICVNGEEVHYTSSTPVHRDGELSSTRELLVGQLVAIRAEGTLSEPRAKLEAKQIAVLNAAVGPLTRVDSASGQFEVMGQKAQALAKEDLDNLRVGDWVRVSGLRLADGSIRAGLVQQLEAPLAQAQVLGPVLNIDGQMVRVGTTQVQFKSRPDFTLGSEIVVRGTWTGSVLEAVTSALDPMHAEIGTAKDVLLQGYVHARHGNELMLGYEMVQLSDTMSVSGGKVESIEINQQVLLRGHVDANQRIVAEQMTIETVSGAGGRGGLGSSSQGHFGSPNGNSGGGNGSGGGGYGGGSHTGRGR